MDSIFCQIRILQDTFGSIEHEPTIFCVDLPDLSAILLDEGIITAPITAVVRKGKERFVCDARLAERASLVQPSRKRQRNSLRIAENILDMLHFKMRG